MLQQNDRVIERQEEAVREKDWQDLQCDQQVYAEESHLLCFCSLSPVCSASPFTLFLKRKVVVKEVGDQGGKVGSGGGGEEGEKLN